MRAAFAALVLGALIVPPAAADRALVEADRLSAIGADLEAVTEYKRYIFFHPDSSAVPIYCTIAERYRNCGRYAEAKQALLSALAYPLNDSLRDAIRTDAAVLDIAAKRYRAAQLELVRLYSFSRFTLIRDRARLLLCFVYSMTGEWSGIGAIAREAGAAGDPRIRIMDSIISSGSNASRKSPGAAKLLSTLVPGTGQIYAGDLKDGLNALAISCATGFLTVHSIVNGYYQEAIFTDVTLFWRYYSGNRWRAVQAAELYNEKKDRQLREKIILLLAGREPDSKK